MWPFDSEPVFPQFSPEDVGSDGPLSADSVGNGVYDYIIVGGGTAGCVIANRLTEDPSVRVLLVDRGGPHSAWKSRVPLLSADFSSQGAPSAKIPSLPLKDVDNSVLDIVAAKALGGGSRINAMLYMRGTPSEYNRWSHNGRRGWSYDEVKSYFIKSENTLVRPIPSDHGVHGPWQNRAFDSFHFDSTARCTEAATAIGIPLVHDINSPKSPVVACAKLNVTIDGNGRSCSTFDAFLPSQLAVERKDRLRVCTDTLVAAIDIEETPDGTLRAVGVSFESATSDSPRTFYARARKEVVLCCGAISTPHLLMLSGVGPQDHLQEHGIVVKKHLPGVGSNLQDHMGVSTMYRIPLSDSFFVLRKSPLRAIQEFIRYMIWGDGLFLLPVTPISLFMRSALLTDDSEVKPCRPSDLDASLPDNIPDIEIMPMAYNTTDDPIKDNETEGIFSFLSLHLQPRSSGTIRLASVDPRANPAVDLGFLNEPSDYEVFRKGVKLSKRVAEKMRENGYRMTDHTVPESESDEDLDKFIRKMARTTYHYAATCRMAPEDDKRPGVVDDELRVHGVLGLRIADASIFPDTLATHLQAPVVMVAEKCADMIRNV